MIYALDVKFKQYVTPRFNTTNSEGEMSEKDLVEEARELLASVPKARPWHAHSVFIPEYSSMSDGYDNRRSVTAGAAIIADAYSEPAAKLIARAPELLSALCDEVERLKRGDFTEEEFQNLCHNTDIQAGFDVFAKGCEAYQQKMFGRCRTKGKVL